MAVNISSFGIAVPWFQANSPVNPTFQFHTLGGRCVVLSFMGSMANELSRRHWEAFLENRKYFDDGNRCFFGVSIDPEDESAERMQEHLPGMHVFWDFDRQLSKMFGAVGNESNNEYLPRSYVLDERLRVVRVLPFDENPENHVKAVLNELSQLPPIQPPGPAQVPAPILVVPRIFEPEFCQMLIKYYEDRGGSESGFMRDIEGKTVSVQDYTHKRRRDEDIKDEDIRRNCMVRIHDRLLPEIHKAFQFRATRIERYIVACYEAETGGHFRAHRDNTTKGTAHRRFAVSMNLNTGEFEGGNLRFPEFGQQFYTAPAGGAVVFSCSLLHEATPVTQGKRYAFLPFLYDDEAAKIRDENRKFLAR